MSACSALAVCLGLTACGDGSGGGSDSESAESSAGSSASDGSSTNTSTSSPTSTGSASDGSTSSPTSTGSASDGSTGTTGGTASPYDKVYNVKSLYIDGDYVVITTADLPDHKSPFYAMGDPLYGPYTGNNPDFSTSINLMGMISDPDLKEQNITFRLPRNPSVAANHQATGFGAIGIAINGVVIFNQYNGMGALLDKLEFNNFDQYNGHPTPAPGQTYHYHIEPTWLTAENGDDALVGFLLDGFPVYGPVEDGKRLSTADLDDYHGHTGATVDYPDGIYHYHCSDDAPWINGDGYYGTPGMVTK